MITKTNETSRLTEAQWAPILFEPIPGSGERIAVALIAASYSGDYRCLSLIDPSAARTLFKEQRGYVKDVLSVVLESCENSLAAGNSISNWQAPLSGLYLGEIQSSMVESVDELVRYAAPMSSFFYRPPVEDISNCKPSERQWNASVVELILSSNARYRQNLNVPVFLGSHEAPAVFTFLNPSLAANLVSLSHNRLKQKIEEARAKLWSLNLLSDAPSWLFRPTAKDLLTGYDDQEDDSKKALVTEAIEELKDEAERRGVHVTPVKTPEEAARHILSAIVEA